MALRYAADDFALHQLASWAVGPFPSASQERKLQQTLVTTVFIGQILCNKIKPEKGKMRSPLLGTIPIEN
ncbi:hypothetical protein [Rhizobium sp. 21-4511-3d]